MPLFSQVHSAREVRDVRLADTVGEPDCYSKMSLGYNIVVETTAIGSLPVDSDGVSNQSRCVLASSQ
jgi:hypothetical protein